MPIRMRVEGPSPAREEGGPDWKPQPLDNADFSRVMEEIIAERGGEGLEPDVVQDGKAEIHPDLEGTTFNFYVLKESGLCAVSVTGHSESAPWAGELGAKVFRGVGNAKRWLRNQAERLSRETKRKETK